MDNNEYNDAIHWFCKSCSSNTAKFLTSMVAIQENVDTIEQEVFHIRNEVRSDIEAKLIQIEQKLEKYAKEVDDKLQVNSRKHFYSWKVKTNNWKSLSITRLKTFSGVIWSEV